MLNAKINFSTDLWDLLQKQPTEDHHTEPKMPLPKEKNQMNILKVTDGQLEYLQELVMFAYEMEVPEQKGWDIQTFDNLVDAVCSPTGQPL